MTGPVAYLLNQYPKVSHSFIRTEMLALEEAGVRVERIAMRGWDGELADPLDHSERERTRYVLQDGAIPLALAVIRVALGKPLRFLDALFTALRLSRGAERGMLLHLIYFAEACRVLGWVRATGASALHAHFGSNAATVALLTKRLGGPPYSFTVHGPEEFDKPLQWKLREKVRGAAFVVAISSFCRSQLYRWADEVDWKKVEVVPCALDDRYCAEPPLLVPNVPELICVGRLCEQKGQLVLIEALALLRERGVAVSLVLAGDGEMRPQIEAAVARQELSDCVRITGWLGAPEVRVELGRARALVLPSFAEGLPIVLMEAMALGRPVITTMIAGIPELVRDGHEGRLVVAGDVEALANAMEELLGSTTETLSAIGKAGSARVRSRHGSSLQAERLAALFAQPRSAGPICNPRAA